MGRVSELNLCFLMTYLSFIKYLLDSLVNKRGSREKQVSGQTIVGKSAIPLPSDLHEF